MTRSDFFILTMILRFRLPLRQWLVGFYLVVFSSISTAAVGQVQTVAGTMPEDYYPTLKVILDSALKQSPTMLTQNIALAQAEAARYSANSPLWPSLSGNASYGVNFAQITDGGTSTPATRSTGLSYGISFYQPLFAWGAVKAGADLGKLAQQITQRQYADAWRSLASTVRSQYLALISKKVALRNLKSRLVTARRDLDAQEQQLREGTISEGEINSPRLNLQEFELGIDRTADEYENAKQLFIRVTGYSQLTEDSIADNLVLPSLDPKSADALLTDFRRGGPSTTLQGQIYQITLKRNDLDYKIARTGLLPRFSLSGNYSLGNNTYPQGQTVVQQFTTNYGASVGVSWTLFDGFRTRGAKLYSLAGKRGTERLNQSYIDLTVDAAEKARRGLDLLNRAVRLTESRRALAVDAVRKVNLDFEEGNSPKSLLDSTVSNAATAEYQAVAARIEYLTAWSDYVALVSVDPALAALPSRYLNFDHGK